MRIVFDTNVVVSGVVAAGLCREIVEIHLPDHTPVLSPPMWDELVEVFATKFGLAVDELPLLALYRRLSVWVEPAVLEPSICRDPDDDWVLATALDGKAEAIVTGDEDLLVLGEHAGIPILSPRRFLESVQPPPT